MSQENVSQARSVYDAVTRRDLEATLKLMDENVVAVSHLTDVEGGTYHGHDGMRRWWANLFEVFPDYAVETVEVRDLGDWTLAALTVHGNATASGFPLTQPLWHGFEWRNGKCTSWQTWTSEADALEALGLSE